MILANGETLRNRLPIAVFCGSMLVYRHHISIMQAPTTQPNLVVPVRLWAKNAPGKPPTPKRGLTATDLAKSAQMPNGTDYDRPEEIEDFLRKADLTRMVSIDTETGYTAEAGLSILLKQEAVHFVQLSQPTPDGAPLTAISRVTPGNRDRIVASLRLLLENPQHHIICHNWAFDHWVLSKLLGISPTCRVFDTLIASRLWYLGFTPAAIKHGLGDCIAREFGEYHDKTEQASEWRLPISDEQLAYMKRDVEYLSPLARKLAGNFKAAGKSYYQHMLLEMRFGEVCRDITAQGAKISIPYLDKLYARNEDKMGPLMDSLQAIARPHLCDMLTDKAREAIDKAEATIAKNKAILSTAVEGEVAELLAIASKAKNPTAKAEKIRLSWAKKTAKASEAIAKAEATIDTTLAFNPGSSSQVLRLMRVLYMEPLTKYFHETAAVLLPDKTAASSQFYNDDDFIEDVLYDEYTLDDNDLVNHLSSMALEAAQVQAFQLLGDPDATPDNGRPKGSSGKPTRDKIIALLGLGSDSFLGLLNSWAKLKKQQGNLKGYRKLATHSPDGTSLHSTYNSIGAATTRVSSTAPNVQNIDRSGKTRQLFVSTPGWRMAVLDLSQIELRVAAELAQEENLLRAFRLGHDVHTTTACLIWQTDIAKIMLEQGLAIGDDLYSAVHPLFDDAMEGRLSDAQIKAKKLIKPFRQLAKSANFGLLYGAGWRGLQAYIFNSSGVMFSEEKCRELRALFFKAYPGLANWHKNISQQCDRNPTHFDIGGVARRWLPTTIEHWNGSTKGKYVTCKNNRLTVGANTPVQGLAAVIMKMNIVAIANAIRDGLILGARIINQVHDEVVLEFDMRVKEQTLEERLAICKKLMGETAQHFLTSVEIQSSAGLCTATNTWKDK
jgi:DNA polymerase I-like protein with 3'-5' exonuclease and polymerase domains